ncbi:hypothetical protein LCGC14_0336240 [marine sediment metagenome]|uniref:Uncharacterized protein n=1 Tax=marine sediment metagenome TaxID=412755 RepID=A0A0F9TKK6_9ZZZZ
MPSFRFTVPRLIRNGGLVAGLALIVGGVAWHDVPAAAAVLGLALTFGAISGMILCRRK